MTRTLALLSLLALALGPAANAQDLDDLLLAMQIVVLDDREPPPFTLAALDGRRVSLADFSGKLVLLYFWESG